MNADELHRLTGKIDSAVLYMRGYIDQLKAEIAAERQLLADTVGDMHPENMKPKAARLYRKSMTMIASKEEHIKALEQTLDMFTAVMDASMREKREQIEGVTGE